MTVALPRLEGRRRQRGAAAMAVVSLLCFAVLLGIAASQRGLIAELRASADAVGSARVGEAAEAGLDWTLAMLDDNAARGDDCLQLSAAGGASSFAERMLVVAAGSPPTYAAATWDDAGTPRPRLAACRIDGDGWHCSCPAHGRPALPPPRDGATPVSFVVAVSAGLQPGIVRASVAACMRADAACDDAEADNAGAVSRIEALFALRPALRSAPVAALTVGGRVASAAAIDVDAGDLSNGGLALHAGGHIDALNLVVSTSDGSPLAGLLAADDPALAALTGDRFFARFFGSTPSAWARQPAAAIVACTGDCGPALAAAAQRGARLLVVHGSARIDSAISLGSAAAPVALVVDGALRVRGSLGVVGVVHAAELEWDGGGTVQGTVLVAGDYVGAGAPRFSRDASVLAALSTSSGSFVRVDGSWKDFE